MNSHRVLLEILDAVADRVVLPVLPLVLADGLEVDANALENRHQHHRDQESEEQSCERLHGWTDTERSLSRDVEEERESQRAF